MKKTVLITGASRGIGATCAVCFAEHGYDVAINYVQNSDAAERVAERVRSLGKRAITVKADVADVSAVESMVKQVNNQLGTIGVLINNAAISLPQAVFTDMPQASWKRMFAVNVDGMFHCTHAVIPQMIHEKSGSVINISSVWGITGASCEVHYSASKAAIIGATKALAKELAPSGIRVNCVAPGVIDTDMNRHLSCEDMQLLREETPLGRIGSPEDIAKAVYFLADDTLSGFTTGQIISPNGGFLI